jgi:hypothetical protein
MRKSRSSFEVALGCGGILVVALLVGVMAYFKLVRWERAAALHLPADSELAARVEVENIALFEPFRANLLPLGNELLPPERPQPATRLERLRARTGLDLPFDLREIVVARGPGARDWIVLLGGKLPKGGVVAGLGEVLNEEGKHWTLSADRRLLSAPDGTTVGECDDGVLLIAASRERAEAALSRQITHERIGLVSDQVVSVAARGRSLDDGLDRLGTLAPDLGPAGRFERVTGQALLGAELRGRLLIRLAPGTDTGRAERQLAAALGQLRDRATNIAGEKRALADARISSPATGILEVVFPVERSGLDRGAAALGAWLRRRAHP